MKVSYETSIGAVTEFTVAGRRETGEILKSNSLTVWVRWQGKAIKRHRRKHGVATALPLSRKV